MITCSTYVGMKAKSVFLVAHKLINPALQYRDHSDMLHQVKTKERSLHVPFNGKCFNEPVSIFMKKMLCVLEKNNPSLIWKQERL